MIAWVVAPFDHVLPVALDDVKVTDPPEQKVVAPPADMVGVAGRELTVIVMLVVAAHCPLLGVNI